MGTTFPLNNFEVPFFFFKLVLLAVTKYKIGLPCQVKINLLQSSITDHCQSKFLYHI